VGRVVGRVGRVVDRVVGRVVGRDPLYSTMPKYASGPFDWMLVNAPALKAQFMSQSSEHDVMLCLQLLKSPFKRLTWQAGPLPKESCNGLPGALLPLSGLISGRSRF
jgi:hypothetical protein